ncbi:MAG: S8 family serine peptidase [Planctomycetaceae bacterium]
MLTADLTERLFDTTMLDTYNGDSRVDSYFVTFDQQYTVDEIKTLTGATNAQPFDLIPGSFNLTFGTAKSFQETADLLETVNGFDQMYPNVTLERSVRFIPNDPLFSQQWHLQNTGQTGGTVGADANVTSVWDNYLGRNVVIGVVDDGLEITHPDLAANYVAGLSFDFVGNDPDPSPTATDDHGTAVAGVAAGRGNNSLGVSGAAPEAKLAGLRLLGANQTATTESSALGSAGIDISNNSWGPADNGIIAVLPPQVAATLQNGTSTGRGGLGRVYVWAGGNGRQSLDYVNYDQYASSRYVIAVGALDHNGRQASYSESGASLLVSAYSSSTPGPGIVTTDLTGDNGYNSTGSGDGDSLPVDYTSTFGGTSSAAPLVSGVVALMLEANPQLTYRDVMDILARTAAKNDPTDSDWVNNGAGLHVNHKYGFGAIDAQAAVNLALNHRPLGTLQTTSSGLVTTNLSIPDNSPSGVSATVTSLSRLTLEHVELTINATHTWRGDLTITLTSPSGTTAVLAETRIVDSGDNYQNFTFTTTRFWGESATGTWTVNVSDQQALDIGTLDSFRLNFIGAFPPVIVTVASSVSENAGTLNARIDIFRPASVPLSSAVTVVLTSSDLTELTVPASVTIPAFQTTAIVSITVKDDNLLDGTQNVNISATAFSFTALKTISVLDYETLTVVLSPTSVTELDGPNAATAVITRSNTTPDPLFDLPLVVNLTSSDTTEATVQSSVVIPASQASVTVPIAAVADLFRDGNQQAIITAAAAGYISITDALTVIDSEGVLVDVVAPTAAENAGQNVSLGRVRRTDINGPFSHKTTQTFNNNTVTFIPDRGTVLSPIVVPSQYSWVEDVDVTVNFHHTWLPDLDVYLISPNGIRVELFTDLSSNATDIIGAILDDSAPTIITSGAAPFTGRYMPESRLDAFYHEQTAGTWYLEVTDDNTFDVGSLLSWSLTLKTEGLEATTVVLSSSDTSEALLNGQSQITVVIPANQSEATFTVDAVDDTLLDGPQTVNVAVTSVSSPNLAFGSDSIVITDYELIALTVSANSVSEAAGTAALTGTIERFNTDLSLPYTVNVFSSDVTGLTVPATVTIPAGQSSVTFPIDAVDDSVIDGVQTVVISIDAPDYVGTKSATVSVTDLEPTLQLSASTTTVAENSGSLEVTVHRIDQADISQPLVVNLSVASVTPGAPALAVPASVTIPGGSDSVTFVIAVLDDALLDGTQITTITASQVNIISGTLDINVTDVESVTLSVNTSEFYENGGPTAAVGTVTRSNTDTSLPLVVTLTSSDTTEASVPSTVTIPAGASSVNFNIAAVNDPDLDGPQSVVLTASATGYFDGTVGVTVLDHEPPVILTPSGNTLNPRPPITWQAMPGAIRYELIVSNLTTGVNQFIHRTDLTGTSFLPTENLGIGRYRVWVRAIDALERPGFWSVPRDFKVETAPVFTAPTTTGTLANPTFPEISWTAVADASRYELWVNNVTSGTVRVLYKTDIVTSTYKSLDGFGSGIYRAFVRAANSKGEYGQWSAAINFTVLAAPVIVTPSTGSGFDRTPTFTWGAIAGATNYDLWVTSRATNQIYLRNLSVTTNSFTATRDFATGDYTVWVRAQSGQVFSAWSQARLFSIGMPPVISSPTAGSSNSGKPTFAWSSVSDTERYELWITDLARNTKVVITNLTTTTYTPATAMAAGSYRVWVRAVSTMGEFSAWSTPVTFTVAAAAPDSQLPLLDLPQLNALGARVTREAVRPSVAVAAQKAIEADRTDVVVHHNAMAIVKEVVANGSDDATAFDAVMSEWSGTDWWQAPVVAVEDRRNVAKS